MACRISVVLPTYNRPGLLLRCLVALVHQDLPPDEYEVIVVHDGPDLLGRDKARQVVEPFIHCRFMHTAKKSGPAAARNMGWRNAKATLIAFTDDDTIPAFNWLSSILEQHKGERFIAYSGKVIVPIPEKPTDYERNTAGLQTAEFVTANCCCTKSALQLAGGFDEQFTDAWREDSDLQFRLMTNNVPIIPLAQTMVMHPVRKATFAISIREQKKGRFNALLYKKYPGLYRQRIQRQPYWNYYIMVIAGITTLIAAIKQHWLLWPALISWLCMLIPFVYRRLKNNSTSALHITEMLVTSLCIPFVSVYWQLYGAVKYRVLLL